MKLATATCVAAIAALTAAAPAMAAAPSRASTKRHATYVTPGYKWNGKIPKVAPVLPGRLIKLGDGADPHVLVDAAGTGQIAYTTQPSPTTNQPSALRDCVLLRGQTGCSANAGLVPPEEGEPLGNADDDGPSPLAIGNELLMLSHRYPNAETLPDGSAGYPTFLWTSEDGGKTFTGPGIVGNLGVSGNAVAFGGDFPQIGVISDTMTGGTFFQATPPGAFTSERLNLGDQGPGEAYNGRLALDGNNPVAEFSDLTGHIYVREYSGAGDIMNTANWSVAKIDGQGYSRIVGGPSGVWLLYQKTFSGPLYLQRIVHGTPSGRAAQVTPGSDFQHSNYAIVEDAQGRITVGWFKSGPETALYVTTSTDGSHFSPPQPIAEGLDQPSNLALGAAQDGGGFAAFEVPEPGGVSGSQIDVAAFGAAVATGLQGLGNLGGDGLGGIGGDPLGTTSCTDVHFGDIDALAESGCFLRDPAHPTSGAAVTAGEIRLNGLEIIPDAGVEIVIDPKQHTINATGSVRVVLRAPVFGDITIWHGSLNVDLSGPAAGDGQTLFQFDTSEFPVSLKGFPIDGTIDVQLQHDSVVIPISLKLPDYMGNVTGQATLLADNVHGFQLDSLHIGVDDLLLGALEVKDLKIDYTASGNVWAGSATINIPAGTPYFGVAVAVRFDDGDFTMGSFDLTVPFPGAPIFTDVYLSGFGGGFDIHPGHKQFFGTVNVGAIPLDPPNYTVGVTGTFTITFEDSGLVVLEADGSGSLHGYDIVGAKLIFQTNGYLEVDGSVNLDLDVARVEAKLNAFIDLPGKEFSSEIQGDLLVAGVNISAADIVMSSYGVAGCGTTLGITYSLEYPWGGSPSAGLGSCDLDPYKVAPVSAARSAAASAVAARVKAATGASVEDFRVSGAGAAPTVILEGPRGNVVPVPAGPAAAKAAAISLTDAARDTTYVMVRNPGSGTWKVVAAPGSAAITAVATANGYPAPSIKARVSGHGLRRRLAYSVTSRRGLSIQFAESAKRVYRVLGTARRGHGSLRFTPAAGGPGRRTIYAIVSQGGALIARRRITTYTAPAPTIPARAAKLRVRRAGKHFVITFARVRSASYYLVRITASDGRHVVELTRRRSLTKPVLGYADRLSVSVTAVSAMGRRGPTSRARSRR
jgi:hypothetical protein